MWIVTDVTGDTGSGSFTAKCFNNMTVAGYGQRQDVRRHGHLDRHGGGHEPEHRHMPDLVERHGVVSKRPDSCAVHGDDVFRSGQWSRDSEEIIGKSGVDWEVRLN